MVKDPVPPWPLAAFLLAAAAWLVALRSGWFWQSTALARAAGILLVVIAPCYFAWQGWYLFNRRGGSRYYRALCVLSWLYVPAIAVVLVWVFTRLPTPQGP